MADIIFYIIFYFVRKERDNISPIHGLKTMCKNHVQGPPKTMGCLGGLAHGLKTICNALLNHV